MPVKPGMSNSPPDCCIEMLKSHLTYKKEPVRMDGRRAERGEGGICLHFRDAEIEVSLGRALSEWIGGELRDEKEGFVCVFIP